MFSALIHLTFVCIFLFILFPFMYSVSAALCIKCSVMIFHQSVVQTCACFNSAVRTCRVDPVAFIVGCDLCFSGCSAVVKVGYQ